MDIISQFENEDKYFLKKFEEIINPSIKIEKDINIKDADDCFNAVVKLLEVYLFPVFIGLIYLNITKYITYKFILLKPYCECLSNLKKKNLLKQMSWTWKLFLIVYVNFLVIVKKIL